MNQILRITSGFLLMLFFLSGCKNKDFVDFYKRPDNLPPCIYQQLVAKGNFKSLVAVIDKAGYKDILSKSGYWTFFAPNDAAFAKYFTDNGISGVSAIDSATAKKIVQYSLVYNSFRQDQLTNYQSTKGVIPDLAFKKKTTFYDFVTAESGTNRKIIGSNRNGTYVAGDNNNKNIPFFTDKYFAANGITKDDYLQFFPGATYSGFSVLDANVVNKDIVAENGIYHEIDKVILPLPNIEQYLASKDNYSEFRNLLKTLVTYIPNSDLTHRYNVLTGSTDSVFVKMYSATLGFSPNNENYMAGGTDSQIGGYTMMAPTNDALLLYTKKLLMYFKTFAQAPPEILMDFVNSHMIAGPVWPVRFAQAFNVQGENPTFSVNNIVEKKLLSNGMFYGTNQAQDANVFRTVYSKPYLNPAFSIMLKGLNLELKYAIINPGVKYTMFMMPDVQVRAGGYNYNSANESVNTQWSYQAPGPPLGAFSAGSSAQQRFAKIINTAVSIAGVNLPDLSGEGIYETYNGEYVKYKNNTIVASGNVDFGNYLVKDSTQITVNGPVHYTHEVVPAGKLSTGGLLAFTEKEIGFHINALAAADPTNFGSFNSLLINSAIWVPANQSILGANTVGAFYTVLIPTNAAIVQAVKDGVLPGNVTTGAPLFTPALGTADADKVTRFLQYHILNKYTVVTDGVKNGGFMTVLTDNMAVPTYVQIVNTINNMVITDMKNRKATVVLSKSNNLSKECVIHSIDNYLMYIY